MTNSLHHKYKQPTFFPFCRPHALALCVREHSSIAERERERERDQKENSFHLEMGEMAWSHFDMCAGKVVPAWVRHHCRRTSSVPHTTHSYQQRKQKLLLRFNQGWSKHVSRWSAAFNSICTDAPDDDCDDDDDCDASKPLLLHPLHPSLF